MIGARTAVSAALVASSTVSGFLIPPTSLSAEEKGGDRLTIDIMPDSKPPQGIYESTPQGPDLTSRIVQLACEECAQGKDGAMQLLLNFSVPGPDRNTLVFNDQVLFPTPEDIASQDRSAVLVPADESIDAFAESEDEPSRLPIELSGSMRVREIEVAGGIGANILEVTFGVAALQDGDVVLARKVLVTLLRNAEGRLGIVQTTAGSQAEHETAVEDAGPAHFGMSGHLKPGCDDMLCGAREKINAKLQELKVAMAKSKQDLKHAIEEAKAGNPPVLEAIEKGKGPLLETLEHGKHQLLKKPCNKHKNFRPLGLSEDGHLPTHNVYQPPTEELELEEMGHAHHPHHHGHHDKHHFFGHSRMHRFSAQAATVVLHIFVPIVFGVLIGLATYAIGVFVGCGIVWVWVKVFRRGGKKTVQYESLPTYDAEEEELFLDSPKTPTDAPPAYIERASQEDVAEKEVQTDSEERRE